MKMKFVVCGLFLAAVALGVWYQLAPKRSTPAISANDLLIVRNIDHKKGAENATMTLIEYLDFECEACGAYYPLVKHLGAEFKDDLQIVTRYFPVPGHKNAMPAALAVEAASRQGRFWEMHDLLFEKQKEWGERKAADPKIFIEYARELGLDMEAFQRDVVSDDVRLRVEMDRNDGMNLGVESTPTFFLNGEQMPNPRSSEEFHALIQQAFSSSKQQ